MGGWHLARKTGIETHEPVVASGADMTEALHGTIKATLDEARSWVGSRVDDIYGANVGRLEGVWDGPDGEPRWLLVREGRFGASHKLIPFSDATAGAGHVWIPYERDLVRHSPAVSPGERPSANLEEALADHYHTRAQARPSAPAPRPKPAKPESSRLRWAPAPQAPAADGGDLSPAPTEIAVNGTLTVEDLEGNEVDLELTGTMRFTGSIRRLDRGDASANGDRSRAA